MKLYPVVDRLQPEDWKALGLTKPPIGPLSSVGMPVHDVHAVYAGEKRPPKKGEWYLSGNPVEAYRAPNDLAFEFHIARLVLTETKTETTVKLLPRSF